jgi:hypothetical protein
MQCTLGASRLVQLDLLWRTGQGAGPNCRVRFDSEPFVPSGFDRITVKTELSRAELSSGDCSW